MKLTVRAAEREDIYRDIARIPEQHRRTRRGELLKEGAVCRLSLGTRHAYVLLRGLPDEDAVIRLDERTRNRLAIRPGQDAEFDLRSARVFDDFVWAWQASDPAYRINARLASLSVALGLLGLGLGILGACRP